MKTYVLLIQKFYRKVTLHIEEQQVKIKNSFCSQIFKMLETCVLKVVIKFPSTNLRWSYNMCSLLPTLQL